MTEYWKSTPRYWCKHCSVFVRDTKLERTNHESTAKHQSALKRFLRDLHRGHERDEREKDRAKREIERLNGAVSGSSSSSAAGPTGTGARRPPPPSAPPSGEAAAAQRQQQWEQLAEMGVEIPTELRREMAMAGEWTVTNTRVINDDDDKDEKVEAMAKGVRKRPKEEGEDEEEEAVKGLFKKRTKWGRDTKQAADDDAELDALLSGNLIPKATAKKEEDAEDKAAAVKTDPDAAAAVAIKEEPADEAEGLSESAGTAAATSDDKTGSPPVKKEEDETEGTPATSSTNVAEEAAPAVVFKKRRPKNVRTK